MALYHPDDTIVAIASPAGPGRRGIVRLSGPGVLDAVSAVFAPLEEDTFARRGSRAGSIRLPSLSSPIPADLLFAPSPRTYTGQDTAEFHLVSSPPLLDAIVGELLLHGARSAQPGEFTQRAFLNGKKDLTQAEAVAAVIDADSADELAHSLTQLAGGMTLPLHELRDDLLNLLADIEAGLDFSDEDIQFVNKPDMLLRLGKGLAHLTNLRKQLDTRGISERPFRVVLVGEPNAGKSSLFNALAGAGAALVSERPGTTRDYLSRSIVIEDMSLELIDTAGWQAAGDTIEKQAQSLGQSQARQADLVLLCGTGPTRETLSLAGNLPTLRIRTKADLLPAAPGERYTSVVSGAGIADLKAELAGRVRAFRRPGLASSLSRCTGHVETALRQLRSAHRIVLFDDPAELLALELRLALDQIGEMIGAIYTDDLLDRIFSRFCIGK